MPIRLSARCDSLRTVTRAPSREARMFPLTRPVRQTLATLVLVGLTVVPTALRRRDRLADQPSRPRP